MGADFTSRRPEFLAAVRTAVEGAVVLSGFIYQREVRRNLNKRGSTRAAGNVASQPGQSPAKQSGGLGRSIILDDSDAKAKNPKVTVGSSLVYAPIQEFGGTITASKAKSLAIPLNAEARASGGPRRMQGLFFIKGKTGRGLLVRKTAGGIQAMFALRRSVRLPARPYFRPALKTARPKIERTIFKAIDGAAARFR